MGGKIKTILPNHPNKLKLKWPNLQEDGSYKIICKTNYNKRHGGKDLKQLKVGD